MADDAFDAAYQAARAELYAADYEDFTPTRVRLAAAAKKAGAADVAKQIAALRKPTRAAWTLNRLARCAGADLAELFELGDALRGAQTSLDGTALRALSAQRRQVVDALVDQALRSTAQGGAAEGLRAEVRSTLEAALVDPDVRADVRAGVLVRAAQFVGFGNLAGPALSLVLDQSPAPPSGRTESGNPTPRASEPTPEGRRTSASAKPTREQAAAQAREARAAEAEHRRVEAHREAECRERQQAEARQTAARAAVEAADAALSYAVDIEKQSSRAVRLAQEQLADARRRLDDARLDVRRARSEQAKAVKALRELH